MSCKICGQDSPLDPTGFCGHCSDKLRVLSHSSSKLAGTSGTLGDTASGDNRPAEPEATAAGSTGHPATSVRVIEGLGQEDTCLLHNPSSVSIAPGSQVLVMDRPAKGRYRVCLFPPDRRQARVVLECGQGSALDQLRYPKGLAADASGNIYVADAGNNRVLRFDPQGAPLGVIGRAGAGLGELNFPCGICIDAIGIIYVADTGNSRVQKFTPQGVGLMAVGGARGVPGDQGLAALDQPLGLTVDTGGNIFVADTNQHRVVKFDPAGQLVMAFGVEGASRGELRTPSSIRVTPEGAIYVTDMDNCRVQTFTPTGIFRSAFILGMWAPSTAAEGQMAIDGDGYVYVSDAARHQVLRLELLDATADSKRS